MKRRSGPCWGAAAAAKPRLPVKIRWAALAIALSLSSCNVAPQREPAIGEAFAGPVTLVLHKDIDAKSATAAIVHHGERLEIISKRRRWYRVRTAKGAEGWTDDNALLDTGQMKRLLGLANETAGLPSQGVASTFGTLRVHSEPNRQSVSFLQVNEGEKFDVIAHRVVTRAPLPKRELVAPKPKAEIRKKARAPGPPPPVAPGPPPDWVQLSKERAMVPESDLPPAAHDDWTLIRMKTGQTGWVLTSRVYLAIPDEVAQYAEGHRITSYFSLGKISDGEQRKDIWLWTTAVELGEDHDFDGYRVFVWSLRHHRYETAYIQRRERGFFPVLARTGEFSVCLENDDGTRVRRMYTMLGNAVRPAGQKACEKSLDVDTADGSGTPNIVVNEVPVVKQGFVEGLKARVKKMFGK